MRKTKKSLFEIAVANKVAEFRRAKGLSQGQLAAMLDVSRGFIGQVESPTSRFTYSLVQLNRVAYEFECSIHDLIPATPIPEKGWNE